MITTVAVDNQTHKDTVKFLRIIENYLRGEHNHETNPIQQKEDFDLYTEAQRLQDLLEPKEKAQNTNVDFRVLGTKLPNLTRYTPYFVTVWSDKHEWSSFYEDKRDFVSYGVSVRQGTTCILCEHEGYTGIAPFEVPLNTIHKLAIEQGIL